MREQKKYPRNKEKDWHQLIKRKYKINIEEYNKILDKQEGCCKICGINQIQCSKRFSVDRCKISGEIRGLLCNNCKLALGNFRYNPEIITKAVLYIRLFAREFTEI